MIEQHRLFIFGKNLLSEGLVKLLATNQNVEIVGCSDLIEELESFLAKGQLDVLMISADDRLGEVESGRLVKKHANVSVLYAYPDGAYLELLSTKYDIACYADLVAAFEALP